MTCLWSARILLKIYCEQLNVDVRLKLVSELEPSAARYPTDDAEVALCWYEHNTCIASILYKLMPLPKLPELPPFPSLTEWRNYEVFNAYIKAHEQYSTQENERALANEFDRRAPLGAETQKNENRRKRSILIYLQTAPEHQGRQLMSFLLAILIRLCPHIEPSVFTITAAATNPISTYLLYKMGATNPELVEYLNNTGTGTDFTPQDAIDYHAHLKHMQHISPEEAEQQLEDALEESTMEELGWTTREEGIQVLMDAGSDPSVFLTLSINTDAKKRTIEWFRAWVARRQTAAANPST